MQLKVREAAVVAGVFLILGFGLGYFSGRSQTPAAATQTTYVATVEQAQPEGLTLPGIGAAPNSPFFGPLFGKVQPILSDALAGIKRGSTATYVVSYPKTTDPGNWILLTYPEGTYLQVQSKQRVPANLVLLIVEPGEQLLLYTSDQNGREWHRFELNLEADPFEDFISEAKRLVASQLGG